MKKNSIRLIGLTIVYLTLIFSIACFSVMKNKENISDKSQIAFLAAIDKERKEFITNITIKYESKDSPDSVSANDKIDWSAQLFLTMEDSCRHRLDSIFREEIKGQGMNLNTSIGYTYKGKDISYAEQKPLKGIRITHEKIYRKDNKKENDITLKAYIYVPLLELIENTTLCILIVLSMIGLTVFIFIKRYSKKQIQGTVTPVETVTRTTDKTRWIIINDDLLWDENNCLLKKGEKTMILKGESLKFFRLFLRSESFFLKHTDIYRAYGPKSELSEVRGRIYHSIKELKKDLTPFGISIKSVRGRGYQLTFH